MPCCAREQAAVIVQLAVSGALWRSYFNFQVWEASSNTAILKLLTQSLMSGCVAPGATFGF